MSYYKEMYYTLFNTMTRMAEMIQEAQLEAEELYLSAEEEDEEDNEEGEGE